MEEHYAIDLVTVDNVVHRGKCILYAAILIATAAGTATVDIYDGVNTTGIKKVPLSAVASTTTPPVPAKDVVMEKGIYVDVGSNVSGVIVIWKLLK